MIRFENVSKGFAGLSVLTNLSFQVDQGMTVALLGLSGSGKTTALKLVCGLYFADQGRVLVNGKVIGVDQVSSLRRQIGYVIQDGGLFPHLNSYANLSIVGREAGLSSAEIRTRIDELATMTKISSQTLSQYPREVSGGQRQRIGIMRALFLNPPVLLLDEPFGSLDPITRGSLQEDLKLLFQELKQSVLLVTHDLFEAGYMAQKILLLEQGRIAQEGSLHDLIENPENDFVRLFVSSHRYPDLEVRR